MPAPASPPLASIAERRVVRAQPWLGTLVEIALPVALASEARFAAGFAAIANVQRTMSAHDRDSDLGRIARFAHRRAIVIDRATFAVLSLARALWQQTHGTFDPGIAPVLARRGRLPAHCALPSTKHGRFGDLQLLDGHRVGTSSPLALDLGGVAKGYAVDRAVAALRAAGATSGLVNAGGDLVVFGADRWTPVRIRDPRLRGSTVSLFEVCNAAVATSADGGGAGDGLLVDPRSRQPRCYGASITIVARSCALADALTKVVALRPAQAPSVLARHGAIAFRLRAVGDGISCVTTASGDAPWLRFAPAAAA
jgi:thiamine biosynthesis lipoprotein